MFHCAGNREARGLGQCPAPADTGPVPGSYNIPSRRAQTPRPSLRRHIVVVINWPGEARGLQGSFEIQTSKAPPDSPCLESAVLYSQFHALSVAIMSYQVTQRTWVAAYVVDIILVETLVICQPASQGPGELSVTRPR